MENIISYESSVLYSLNQTVFVKNQWITIVEVRFSRFGRHRYKAIRRGSIVRGRRA